MVVAFVSTADLESFEARFASQAAGERIQYKEVLYPSARGSAGSHAADLQRLPGKVVHVLNGDTVVATYWRSAMSWVTGCLHCSAIFPNEAEHRRRVTAKRAPSPKWTIPERGAIDLVTTGVVMAVESRG